MIQPEPLPDLTQPCKPPVADYISTTSISIFILDRNYIKIYRKVLRCLNMMFTRFNGCIMSRDKYKFKIKCEIWDNGEFENYDKIGDHDFTIRLFVNKISEEVVIDFQQTRGDSYVFGVYVVKNFKKILSSIL